MKLFKLMAGVVFALAMTGCAIETDDDPDVVVPGRSDTTIIEKGAPDVHVSPAPDVNIKTDSPGGTVTTTGQ